jgi:hypothetical protein
MLRKRQYDYIYSGLNFLSLLWGLGQQQKNKTVLILNSKEDRGLQTPALWGLLNYFEYLSFKKKWQTSLGDVSKNDFFIPSTERFYFNNEVLLLGQESPRKNLLELKRKFKDLYPKSSLNIDHFDEIIFKLAKEIFTSLQNTGDYSPSRKEYEGHAVLLFLLEFSKNIETKDGAKLLQDCLSPLRFYYLFEPKIKENILVLLILNLLPRFSFNEQHLTTELRNYFSLSGGEIKDTFIENVNQAPNRDLLQVRIQSVEGMLLTSSLLFFGAVPEEGVSSAQSSGCDKHFWSEICLNIEIKYLDPALVQGAKVFLIDDQTHSEQFGPVWLRFRGEVAYFFSFYSSRFGFNDKDNRTEFYQYLKSIFLRKFNFSLPELSQFSQLPISDQLSYWPGHNVPFLNAEYRNDPVSRFSNNVFYTGLSSLSYHGMSKLFWPQNPQVPQSQKTNQGQTAIEYLLLLLVVATVGFALMKKLNEKLVGNAGDCTQGGDSLICKIQSLMNAEGNFKYFRINK